MKTSTKQDSKRTQPHLQQTRSSSQPTVALPVATTTGTGPEAPGHKTHRGPAASFEVVLEAIRHRHEAKTAILEEALQRSECSQQRFWGINE